MVAQGLPAGARTETHLTWLDFSQVADISSDAKRVLIHERGDASESPNGTIYVENIDGSGGVRLAAGQPTEFSPDGKWVLANPGKSKTFSIVPVGPGTVQEFQVPSDDIFEVIGFLPPNGKDVLVWSRDSGGSTTVWAQNTAGGKPTKVTRSDARPMRGRVISPDGMFVIASEPDDRRFVLLSLKDGKVQPLPGLESGEEPIQWARDGKSIFVCDRHRVPASIFRVDVLDGKRVLFKEISPSDRTGVDRLASIRIAADEQTFAYTFVRDLSSLYLIKGCIDGGRRGWAFHHKPTGTRCRLSNARVAPIRPQRSIQGMEPPAESCRGDHSFLRQTAARPSSAPVRGKGYSSRAATDVGMYGVLMNDIRDSEYGDPLTERLYERVIRV